MYTTRAGTGQGRRSVQDTDILRAAVVLLHATLEDLLRSLADWKLPTAEPMLLMTCQLPALTEGQK